MSFRKRKDIAYASDSPEAAAETQAAAAPEPEAQDEGVPEGTTAEILAWVGDDKDRAQAALDREQSDDKPRVGLTRELEELLAEEPDES